MPFLIYGLIAVYFILAESALVATVYEPMLTVYLPPEFVEQRLGDTNTYHTSPKPQPIRQCQVALWAKLSCDAWSDN